MGQKSDAKYQWMIERDSERSMPHSKDDIKLINSFFIDHAAESSSSDVSTNGMTTDSAGYGNNFSKLFTSKDFQEIDTMLKSSRGKTMSIVTITLTEIAERLDKNQEKSTILFIQVKKWMKRFRKYMKQFVKDTGIHKILELYTADEYLKLFTEKKVKNKAVKVFTLKDSSDEDIFTKARLKIDWKSIEENYLDANHMHNNADEYHGIQVENDSD